MKKKIILHGYLRDLYDREIEVEAETVAEAIRSLQFIPELQPASGEPHPVFIQGVNSEIQLFGRSDMEEIHVHPRAGGAGGKNGLIQILLGVALIALAIWNPAFLAPLAEWGITKGVIMLMGASMVVGGLIQMLMPQPEEDKTQNSKYLGASANTVQIGTRIPLIYGARKAGGHYLSFDVDAKNIPVEASGEEDYEGAYVEHDKTPISDGIVPVLPVYASSVPAFDNIPTSAWNYFNE